ncbi:PadR family transcriptional regulator [Myxococcus llanfairpwllgwyngyllgogerychwyrndrobwllllantysiliogogogochensis]|uniref:PadR family transcriptional regulator n=1 Tax=Myxococcus llanfairpwllgwyngyllgogerychwyrndrobwllllantysiliogogogochensis TaxID=2590453 RepID=A0A540WU81_9BACT|nr:PadR family transcriptional regulator [Myxococcus llanfairpwllgwyngyllgogerychwyrndrobwllllantysiliogogogochensis]TQF12004.1 PadR family transcriptional regulator [Myxococcus llanfairpwllgwyngyllgogerychwyrndrobwllllantysiliogogogochensis]
MAWVLGLTGVVLFLQPVLDLWTARPRAERTARLSAAHAKYTRSLTEIWCGILGVVAQQDGYAYALTVHNGLVGRGIIPESTDPLSYVDGFLRDMAERGWLTSRAIDSSPVPGAGPPIYLYSLTESGRRAREVLTQ